MPGVQAWACHQLPVLVSKPESSRARGLIPARAAPR